jgi:hypothetical protein
MFRISRFGSDEITDVAQVDEIEPAIRSSKPVRYLVDEICADPVPSGHTSPRWGVAIKRQDGSVVIERRRCTGLRPRTGTRFPISRPGAHSVRVE